MMATCTALSTTLLLFYYHNVLHSMIIDHFPIHVHVGIDRRKLLHVDCATPVDSRATAWQKWSHKKKCSHQPSTLAKPAVASSLSSPPSNRSSSSPTEEKKPSMKQYHRGQEQRQDACNHPNEDSRGVCAKMHNVTSRRFDGGGHWWQFQYEQGGRQQLSQSVDGWLAQRMCNPRRKVLEASSPAQQKHSNNNGHHNQKNNTLLPLLVHQGGRDSSSLRGAPTASSTSGAAEVAETSAGRSACVCYSGLLRGFADGAVAENHIAFLLDPMRQELSFQVVAVAFSLEGKEQIPDAILKKYSAVATHVRREAIAASPSSREAAAVGRSKGNAQYAGIFHCGLLLLALELERGAHFDYAIKARYDMFLFPSLSRTAQGRGSGRSAAMLWPIWQVEQRKCGDLEVMLFAKHGKKRSNFCLMQDVFLVARARHNLRRPPCGKNKTGDLGYMYSSAAWLFLDKSRRRLHVSGDRRDQWEATLLSGAFSSGAVLGVVSSCTKSSGCWCLRPHKPPSPRRKFSCRSK
jgi:hypothetical protein